jgi:hypothetical protein
VGVLHDGTVTLDGKQDTLSDVDARFAAAEKARGMVWYYRDAAVQPTAAGERTMSAVIDLVAKHRLSITLSSKPDYSDVFNMRTGELEPRPGR